MVAKLDIRSVAADVGAGRTREGCWAAAGDARVAQTAAHRCLHDAQEEAGVLLDHISAMSGHGRRYPGIPWLVVGGEKDKAKTSHAGGGEQLWSSLTITRRAG